MVYFSMITELLLHTPGWCELQMFNGYDSLTSKQQREDNVNERKCC